MKQYYVYILKCVDESYYKGITSNLERRLLEHNKGEKIECYTFTRRPIELVFYEMFTDPTRAIETEKQIKGWSRKKKEALIKRNWERLKELAECKNKTSHKHFKDSSTFESCSG